MLCGSGFAKSAVHGSLQVSSSGPASGHLDESEKPDPINTSRGVSRQTPLTWGQPSLELAP